ncbi:MAG: Bug family tripartite tricarboxylate transporter substrate binding protein [Rhodospirillales bacterium]
MIKRLSSGAVALALLAALGISGASAQYPEKEITFLIPYKPGGGFDTYVRALVPVMEKRLKVTVVPKNMPGAGGRKAASYLYKSKPDGYRISIMNLPGKAIAAIQGKKTGYDIRKFTWLGRIATDGYVIAVAKKSPFKSVADLKKAGRTIKVATTGPGSTAYVVSKIAAKVLGLDFGWVTGYKGSSGMSVAVIRGDTDIGFFVNRSYAKFAKSGDLRGISSLQMKAAFPGLENLTDLKAPELASVTLQRLVAGPPGLPKDIKGTLANALYDSVNDPDFQAWSKKSKRPVQALRADEAAKLIDELVTFYTRYKDALK